MFLANHPINRLLNDPWLWFELISQRTLFIEQSDWAKRQVLNKSVGIPFSMEGATEMDQAQTIFLADPGKLFLVTNTVIDKLSYLKLKKIGDKLDWSVMKHKDIFTSTFILPNNECLRVRDQGGIIMIMLLEFRDIDVKANHTNMHAHYVYLDKEDYSACHHLDNDEYMKKRSDYIYKLLVFIYFSEISEEILKPGQKKGTKKIGKVLNSLKHDITIIDSKWNITSIRNEAFGVSGHYAIRWCGVGKTDPRVVWINPFVKNGYVRKAKSSNNNE